jgi:hypothetical protein
MKTRVVRNQLVKPLVVEHELVKTPVIGNQLVKILVVGNQFLKTQLLRRLLRGPMVKIQLASKILSKT